MLGLRISRQIFTKEVKVQRAGKLGGSSRIMSILDYLITWLDKFHLNVSKAPHTLEHLTVHGEKKGEG